MITYRLSVVILVIQLIPLILALSCIPRIFDTGIVCVCNATYCDTLDNVNTPTTGKITILTSSKDGYRFKLTEENFDNLIERHHLNDDYKQVLLVDNTRQTSRIFPFFPVKSPSRITVNRLKTNQKILGFGGAFTGAVSYLLKNIDSNLASHFYNSYYSHSIGIGYNFMRWTIGGSDCDTSPWAYNELPINDLQLSNFTQLDSRDVEKVKQVKELIKATGNDNIKIIGSAWSSPKWMKTNGQWNGKSALKKEYYNTWAQYHLRFLQLMAKENLTFWGITTGNEPLNGNIAHYFIPFMSLGWSPQDQGIWLKENLGPIIRNSEFKDLKILGPDDQRYVLPLWFNLMNSVSRNSSSYLDGIAVHWYWDKFISPSFMDVTHNENPEKFILITESSLGDKPWEKKGPVLGSWDRAEHYISLYMQNLNHWANGWVDWNLMLNEIGGPNYVKNYLEAAIILDKSGQEFYKQPIYYAIGHFSKFFTPDSVRIDTKTSDSKIEVVGVKRPDGSIATVIYNGHTSAVKVLFIDESVGQKEMEFPAKSLNTLIYT